MIRHQVYHFRICISLFFQRSVGMKPEKRPKKTKHCLDLLDSDTSPTAVRNAHAPPSKKLRSCEPDLKIIVKWDGDGRNVQKEYEEYAVVLANLSNFVDTALSSGMREEATREIVFEDTTGEVYELARKIEDDASVSRSLNAIDAMKVVRFYHKYDFPNGLKLCDSVLCDHISNFTSPSSCSVEKLEGLAGVIAAAEELDLVKTKRVAIGCVTSRLDLNKIDRNTSPTFTLEQMRKLHPFIQNISSDQLPPFLQKLWREELNSPLLPRYIVEKIEDKRAKLALETERQRTRDLRTVPRATRPRHGLSPLEDAENSDSSNDSNPPLRRASLYRPRLYRPLRHLPGLKRRSR